MFQRRSGFIALCIACFSSAVLQSTAYGQCQFAWSSRFGSPGVPFGNKASILCSVVFDDGTGPALYVGGRFSSIEGVPARGVARLDLNGGGWSDASVGFAPTLTPQVQCMVVHDDGTGPALYAGGSNLMLVGTIRVAVTRLTSTGWVPVQGAVRGPTGDVRGPASYDEDGPGGNPPRLIAVGGFAGAGGVTVNHVARWDGSQWTGVGTGLTYGEFPAAAYCVAAFDEDGDGPNPERVFIGGQFGEAGGTPMTAITRWDGTSYTPVGTGLSSSASVVCLHIHDDGSGPALFAGGSIGGVNGIGTVLAKWNGSVWSPVGTPPDYPTIVLAISSFDGDGSGPEPSTLIIGGSFIVIGENVARWNGVYFSPMGAGMDDLVWTLTNIPGASPASPERLLAGGTFDEAGGHSSSRIALWRLAADWNDSGGVDSQDFFDFIAAFFATC